MDKETFITRLSEACNSALKLAREFTFNEIADNLIFKIKSNTSSNTSEQESIMVKQNNTKASQVPYYNELKGFSFANAYGI